MRRYYDNPYRHYSHWPHYYDYYYHYDKCCRYYDWWYDYAPYDGL